MTDPTPVQPVDTKTPEPKVRWAAAAATALTTIVYVANNTSLIFGYDQAPDWVKAVVSIVVIAGGTFAAGYRAPHQFRRPLPPGAGPADTDL